MAEKDREDLRGNHLDASYKLMDTAEERFRMRPRVTGIMTRSVHVTRPTKFAWQGGHLHRSGREYYHRVSDVTGWVSLSENGVVRSGIIWDCHQLVYFEPGVAHDIFTAPNSEFITWQVRAGGHTPNPDRKGDDWWPVDSAFEVAVADARRNTESLVRRHHGKKY